MFEVSCSLSGQMLAEEKIGVFQDVTVIRHDKGYAGGGADVVTKAKKV
jgi:hypothetical protein